MGAKNGLGSMTIECSRKNRDEEKGNMRRERYIGVAQKETGDRGH